MIIKIIIEITKDYIHITTNPFPMAHINGTPLSREETKRLISFLKSIPLPVEEHEYLDSLVVKK